jgi:hypothetical protein
MMMETPNVKGIRRSTPLRKRQAHQPVDETTQTYAEDHATTL